MADVLIKGMAMPWNCECCPIREGTFCDIIGKDIDRFYGGAVRRDKDCPLVKVPPHGRLVDADKLLIDIMDRNIDQAQFDDYSEFCHAIHEAPTVIEASEE